MAGGNGNKTNNVKCPPETKPDDLSSQYVYMETPGWGYCCASSLRR
jgi:hypothetical protein